jgi:hypothetical protein
MSLQGRTLVAISNKDGKLCGYCEMKSPRHDYILEKPVPGEADPHRTIYGGMSHAMAWVSRPRQESA